MYSNNTQNTQPQAQNSFGMFNAYSGYGMNPTPNPYMGGYNNFNQGWNTNPTQSANLYPQQGLNQPQNLNINQRPNNQMNPPVSLATSWAQPTQTKINNFNDVL